MAVGTGQRLFGQGWDREVAGWIVSRSRRALCAPSGSGGGEDGDPLGELRLWDREGRQAAWSGAGDRGQGKTALPAGGPEATEVRPVS